MPGISEKQRKFRSRREEKRRECMGFSDINLSNWDLYTFAVTNYTSSPVRTIYMKVRKTIMTPMWERDIRKKETKSNPLIFLR